jgi:hypothetical protein
MKNQAVIIRDQEVLPLAEEYLLGYKELLSGWWYSLPVLRKPLRVVRNSSQAVRIPPDTHGSA